jgi:hypothetical protein
MFNPGHSLIEDFAGYLCGPCFTLVPKFIEAHVWAVLAARPPSPTTWFKKTCKNNNSSIAEPARISKMHDARWSKIPREQEHLTYVYFTRLGPWARMSGWASRYFPIWNMAQGRRNLSKLSQHTLDWQAKQHKAHSNQALLPLLGWIQKCFS